MATQGRGGLGASAWRAALARFAHSDMTVGAFCKRERVCLSSFYRWRSILGSNEGEPTAVEHAVAVAQRPAPFVDLGPLGAGGSRLEVRVDLGGGLTLSVVRS